MPTSIAAPSSNGVAAGEPAGRRAGAAGFTLIEIALVLLIMAIVLALAIPRLRSITGADLNKQVRQLSNIFRLLRSEAILNGRIYQLHYDLGSQRYWVTSVTAGDSPDLGTDVADIGPLARPVSLQSPVGISDVVLPESFGKVQAGQGVQVVTNFYPDGFTDLTVIHLDDGREAYTLWVNPLTGRISLAQGYQDVDYGK